jgi:hypothetical protein
MEKPPNEHQKVLRDLDRLLNEAPDEASRNEIRRLRDSLNTPEMIEMARAAEQQKDRTDNPVLEFHDPLLPTGITATGCVVAAAICLYAIVLGFESSHAAIAGASFNPWIVAMLAGAITMAFTALSLTRTFSVRFDTEGMASRTNGARWRKLCVGTMPWKQIRSLQERREDGVLEVRAAGGRIFEIPLRVANYPILRHHLDNMVMLYGERA